MYYLTKLTMFWHFNAVVTSYFPLIELVAPPFQLYLKGEKSKDKYLPLGFFYQVSEIFSILNHTKNKAIIFKRIWNYEFLVNREVPTMLVRHFGPREMLMNRINNSKTISIITSTQNCGFVNIFNMPFSTCLIVKLFLADWLI